MIALINERLVRIEKKLDELSNFKFQVIGIVIAVVFIFELFVKK